MPTIPLYDSPSNPDAWHRIRAPGGYEWWRLSALSPNEAVGVWVDLYDGDPRSAAYLAAYDRYRRRPTRVPPPVPRDYPRVRAGFRDETGQESGVDATYPPGSLVASEDGLEIRIDTTVLRFDGDAVRVTLDAGELTFTPILRQPPDVREIPGDIESVVHVRTIRSPAYDVTGVLGGKPFNGRGTYTHYFGTGPIGGTNIY